MACKDLILRLDEQCLTCFNSCFIIWTIFDVLENASRNKIRKDCKFIQIFMWQDGHEVSNVRLQ